MSPANWERTSQAHRNALHRQYWINMKSLAQSGVFDIVAHLDLAKKFGFYPDIDLSKEIDAALDAIAEASLVVELNTSGWHKPCADGYPTLEILRKCCARGIRTTINADAHQPEHLTRDFDRAVERLAAAGYTHIARFAGREVRMEPLADALKARRQASGAGVSMSGA
jgi:histidinol-phosphatase (PHP family)